MSPLTMALLGVLAATLRGRSCFRAMLFGGLHNFVA
jgi:hypothetical protein